MKCPKCQFENREGAKFCGKCSTKLSRICPGCNAENPPGNEFCDECGHQLSLPSKPIPKELPFDEKIRKIPKYLPRSPWSRNDRQEVLERSAAVIRESRRRCLSDPG